MNFSDLTQEVYNSTSRSDLVNETKTALKSATLKMHQVDFWDKDIFETGINFSVSAYYQQFQYLTIIPRWRAAKYFRKVDATGQPLCNEDFKIKKIDALVDSYGRDVVDVAYQAGSQFNFKSYQSFQYMLMGCYVHPDITDAGYSSWIATEYPYAIIYEAARIVLKAIGLDQESAYMDQMCKEQMALLSIGNVQSVGY